jgi:hypothetical protein
MCLHNPENWKLNRVGVVGDTDRINDEIWNQSPQRQSELAAQFPVGATGCIGGQQAMFRTRGRGSRFEPLPWVPDLVGRKSQQKNAVMIIGSAYAPFVTGFTSGRGRNGQMTLAEYQDYYNWYDFQSLFLTRVVENDSSYYENIRKLLEGGTRWAPEERFDWKRVILTDWCRASLVQRGPGMPHADKGGDKVCRSRVSPFFSYAAANFRWHKERFISFQGKIIVLGDLAHDCLAFFCLSLGWQITYTPNPPHVGASVGWPRRPAEFWDEDGNLKIVGKIWVTKKRSAEFLVVSHPGARNGHIWPRSDYRQELREWIGQ